MSVVDGGTQGLYLLDYVCAADRVLVFDAIDYGLAAGHAARVSRREVPRRGPTPMMSLHQAAFQELLSLARLRGRFPREDHAHRRAARRLDDLGGSLSPLVRRG